MRILVILKQKVKFTQEVELVFYSWSRAKDFIQEALMSGSEITVEVSKLPDCEPTLECEAGSPFAVSDRGIV